MVDLEQEYHCIDGACAMSLSEGEIILLFFPKYQID